MESKKYLINDFAIDCYRINTLIIGSGAASLNAAVSLHSLGQKDIIIATSDWGGGTSNNAGSDKQTYYKLSLSGEVPDSVSEMASDLFNGKCMQGDIALCEAQGSVQAFMNLVNLGVRFPHDKYGAWAGYQTDNDRRNRATSAGPYTSKRMFEALAAEVKKREVPIFDHHHCIALLTDIKGTKVIGALALNIDEDDHTKAFVLFDATNVILGTGGPAGIYETTVYPVSQSGSTGMAFKAGASGQNLTESQFGIASVKFRWNLSGSYQQAIPRYISTDPDGKDEREFLNDFFPDIRTLSGAIFLKGYQWPFDPEKVRNYGSSLIDLLVYNEINEKGRKVFLDFTRNPSREDSEEFSLEDLDQEPLLYLRNSSALKDTPVERLRALNNSAIALYMDRGIDLTREYLQIAVCAQHNNGGLKANIWWESDLKHLFPVGEVNGSHGVHRPGGSALNSGQVGSYRAAQYISKKYVITPLDYEDFFIETAEDIKNTLALVSKWMQRGSSPDNKKHLSEIRKRMAEAGGIIRDIKKAEKASAEAAELLKKLPKLISTGSVMELYDSFILMDQCMTHLVYLGAIKFYIEMGGRSRGSYIVADPDKLKKDIRLTVLQNPELCRYDRDVENKILVIVYKDGAIHANLEEVKEIPEQNLWFEKVWKDYLEDIFPDD